MLELKNVCKDYQGFSVRLEKRKSYVMKGVSLRDTFFIATNYAQ
ncbi:hypothetical protein [Bacillus sp. S10(2024)]|nr:hypothetical protein [Bacillus sp. BP-3]